MQPEFHKVFFYIHSFMNEWMLHQVLIAARGILNVEGSMWFL